MQLTATPVTAEEAEAMVNVQLEDYETAAATFTELIEGLKQTQSTEKQTEVDSKRVINDCAYH